MFKKDKVLSKALDFVSYQNKQLVVTKNPFGFQIQQSQVNIEEYI